MAKRRRFRTRRVYVRVPRRRSRSGMPKELKNIVAGIGVGITEPLLDQLASKFGLSLSDEVVKMGGGFVIKKLARGQGIGNAIGDAFMILGANRLAQGGFTGITDLFRNNQNNNVGNNGATF